MRLKPPKEDPILRLKLNDIANRLKIPLPQLEIQGDGSDGYPYAVFMTIHTVPGECYRLIWNLDGSGEVWSSIRNNNGIVDCNIRHYGDI